jgi:hypothetical protein
MTFPAFLDSPDPAIYTLRTTAPGPAGKLPLTAQLLRNATSGHVFGMTQNAGMGWDPRKLRGKEFLILSTQGGIRAPDGTPVALGYHTGHWEVGLLMEEAARALCDARRHALRRLRERSLRRPLERHARDVRQPAVPQRRGDPLPPAHPLAADLPRGRRRRHLRQGPARDDDGAGRHEAPARHPRARRHDAPHRGGRGHRQGADPRRTVRAG